jgi:hypothetical protein
MFKGSDWMSRASKRRMSVWKVSDKRPGTYTLLPSLPSSQWYFRVWLCLFYVTFIWTPLGYNASDSDSDEVEDDRK